MVEVKLLPSKILYLERLNNKNSRISQRCCDFKFLEIKLNQFILNQEKSE